MRIALAGMMHESCTFSRLLADLDDFQLVRGADIVEYLNIGDALPAGCGVRPAAVRRRPHSRRLGPRERLCADPRGDPGRSRSGGRARRHLPGHARLVVRREHLQRRGRSRSRGPGQTGHRPLIAARLDAHANLSEEFANKTDIWTPFRTAPHRDHRDALERTLTLLVRALRAGRRPRPVFIRVPALIPGEMATTESEPMRSLQSAARHIETLPGILSADVVIGFANTDVAYGGLSVVVIAEDDSSLPLARSEARQLAQRIWDSRHAFGFDRETAPTLDDAVATALRAPEPSVFIADVGDNPTAGVPGDNPHSLQRLLALGVTDAVLAGIVDAAAFSACAQAGIGQTVTVELGGKLDVEHGAPLRVTGVVEHLYRSPETNAEPTLRAEPGDRHSACRWRTRAGHRPTLGVHVAARLPARRHRPAGTQDRRRQAGVSLSRVARRAPRRFWP